MVRGTLVALLLAATAATPALAQSQGWHGQGSQGRSWQGQAGGRGDIGRPGGRMEGPAQRPDTARPTLSANASPRWNGSIARGNGAEGARGPQRPAPQRAGLSGNEDGRDRAALRRGDSWSADPRTRPGSQPADSRYRDRTIRYGDRDATNGRPGNSWNDRDRPGRDNRWDNRERWDDRRDRDRRDNQWDNRNRWSQGWRNDNRYDWQHYRQSNRYIYRLPVYYGPAGHGGYRRWAPGYRLPGVYYVRSYWISDPWYYRLPPIYGPYRWVRYYDDVLLIDTTTGLIEDVIPGFFWR